MTEAQGVRGPEALLQAGRHEAGVTAAAVKAWTS